MNLPPDRSRDGPLPPAGEVQSAQGALAGAPARPPAGGALHSLRQQLHKALAGRPRPAALAGDAAALARVAAVRRAFDPPRGHASLPRIARGVMSFRLLRRKTAYPDLKYACYGIAQPMDWEGRLLLDEERLLDDLLTAVAALRRQPGRYCRCYRGLLVSWLNDVARAGGEFSWESARPGERKLGAFLLAGREALARAPRPAPWIAVLQAAGLDDGGGLRRALGLAGAEIVPGRQPDGGGISYHAGCP